MVCHPLSGYPVPIKQHFPLGTERKDNMEWFKCYTDWSAPMMCMTDEEAGKMIKAIFYFVQSKQVPKLEDRLAIFGRFIFGVIAEDIKTYEAAVAEEQEKRAARSRKARAAALKRWENA